jgi:transcriptional regulator with PAS, ATPase and Fis domain
VSDFALATPALLGDSPRIREIRALIPKLARSRSPLLLLGETGTGKEVLARAIHGAAGSGCFVPIDCSVLGNLLETELFGHVRGAFTGAVANKPGLLEIADGGTAFLDEVGELPLDLQTKLLRVLQDREIRPLGSLVHRKTDFRTIAATNRDLQAAVRAGSFREDLFWRLNVVNIHIPPLRERPEDIPVLAEHFLARFAQAMNRRPMRFSPGTLDALAAYPWPGNVRELQNAIERAVVVGHGETVEPSALPLHVIRAPAGPGPGSLAEAERAHIQSVLDASGWNITRAARVLDVDRVTLYNKIKKYELKKPERAG